MIWPQEKPRWDRDGRDWPHREASRFVRADGMTWHVQLFGPPIGAAPVALLLHGAAAANHSWAGLAPILAERASVIAPDLPGHGFTETPWFSRLSTAGMASALSGLLTALGATPTTIIGHSAGAALALRMMLDGHAAPSAVVGINAALTPFEGAAGAAMPAMAGMLALNPAAPRLTAWGLRWAADWNAFARSAGGVAAPISVARLIDETGSRLSPAQLGPYERLLSAPGHVAGALGMLSQWTLDGLLDAAAGVDAPMLLIAGADDRAVAPQQSEAAAARLRRAEALILPGLGHLAHEEDPGAVAAPIRAFFDRTLSQA